MSTILSGKTNLAAAIRNVGIGLAGIGRFPGYTLTVVLLHDIQGD